MYEQIKAILEQNRIPFKDFAWVDEFNKLQLNNSAEWTEYIEDPIDQGILFYFIEDTTKYYKVINKFDLGFTTVFVLNEVVKNE